MFCMPSLPPSLTGRVPLAFSLPTRALTSKVGGAGPSAQLVRLGQNNPKPVAGSQQGREPREKGEREEEEQEEEEMRVHQSGSSHLLCLGVLCTCKPPGWDGGLQRGNFEELCLLLLGAKALLSRDAGLPNENLKKIKINATESCHGFNNPINCADTSQTGCHVFFMSDLRGGLIVPYFWENGLSDLLKFTQQSGIPTVHQTLI